MKAQSAPLRIFLVEDHPDTMDYLKMYLEQLGHTVLSAGSMQEALEALPRADCDVLISDLGLPDGLGWDLLSRLQPRRPLYAVAMSGFNRAADIAQSKATGFHHHLRKPFTIQDLNKVLDEAREFAASSPN
ncbi:MAG: response regulator [Verrucomicrobiaceae bacterium]|nr:MAG: response regulator [Verrucomicrobiaceae bacterium]